MLPPVNAAWGSARAVIASLKCEPCADMCAQTRAHAARDGDLEVEQRSGRPDSGADASLQFLIVEALAFVIRRAGVHEDADAEPCHSKRRRRRDTQLGRTGDDGIADGMAGSKPTKIAGTTQHRLIKCWCRRAEVFTLHSQCQYRPAIDAHVAVRIDLSPDRRRR